MTERTTSQILMYAIIANEIRAITPMVVMEYFGIENMHPNRALLIFDVYKECWEIFDTQYEGQSTTLYEKCYLFMHELNLHKNTNTLNQFIANTYGKKRTLQYRQFLDDQITLGGVDGEIC